MNLKGSTAILTGASRGIGRFIALALAREGVHLALAARSQDGLNQVAHEIKEQYDVQVVTLPTDVAELEQLDRLVRHAREALGPIDLLINNAALERAEIFWETKFSLIERDLAVNVRAPMYLSQKVLPEMLERNRGHIVNIASLSGLGGYPNGESYVTTKHAVVGFTRALRASLMSRGSDVGASSICPGFITEVGMFARKQEATTEIKPPSMMGASKPDAVARAVIKAIRRNQAEVVVNPMPVRPFLALFALGPQLGEWLSHRLGINDVGQKAIAIKTDEDN